MTEEQGSGWEVEFEEGDFYWDERGFRVFTKQYLLKRGYCCNNSCKHCPYGDK